MAFLVHELRPGKTMSEPTTAPTGIRAVMVEQYYLPPVEEVEDDPSTERELEDDPPIERVSVLLEVEDAPPTAPELVVVFVVVADDEEEELEGFFAASATAEEAANAAVALGFLMRWTNRITHVSHEATNTRLNSFSPSYAKFDVAYRENIRAGSKN